MAGYLLRRLFQAAVLLWVVSLVTFVLIHAAPGGPAMLQNPDLSRDQIAQFRANLGLDDPVPVQYLRWLRAALHGDLGRSYNTVESVGRLLATRLPNTLLLTGIALGLSLAAAIPLGVACATRRNTAFDRIIAGTAFLGISTPVFWLGMMLSLLFAVWLGWLPVSGYGEGAWANLVLPALTLAAVHTGTIARMARSSLLEVIRQEYIQGARAKGLAEWRVVAKHALRNALIPVVTVIGIGLADLLVGAPLTETVFAWPGIGRMLVAAVGQRDLPLVMGAVLVFAVIYVVANLLVDLAYLVIDPRIRRGR